MSKYTTEVRYICEKAAGYDESQGFARVDQIIRDSLDHVFSFDFPIFDESYRSVLETKILRHYYTREIGFETVGLWQLKLETKLNEIMPFYNQLYESELIKFNPLYDVDLNTTNASNKESSTSGSSVSSRSGSNNTDSTAGSFGSGETEGASSASRTTATANNDRNTKYDLYSDTPQGGLAGVDTETYLTNARKITDTNDRNNTESATESSSNRNSSNNSTFTQDKSANQFDESGTESRADQFTSTENYLTHVAGKQGGVSYSKMLMEFRDTFLNIDMQVIEDLGDLFLNLW